MDDASNPAVRRREVLYSGHAPGGGLRYSVQHLAASYRVVGYVRNLADGRVQLVAEGAPRELSDFFAAVRERLAPHIRTTTEDERPATGEFHDFAIRH